jgi:hypothetical protein
MTYLPTSAVATINDYPYGRLKCTMTISIEFDKKKGFRVVRQTINPKTNRLNAPKKSTYSDLCVLTDTDGFINAKHISFNGGEEINKGCKFLAENFDLFTPEQITYFYALVFEMSKIHTMAVVTYTGAKMNDVLPLMDSIVKTAVRGVKSITNENFFNEMVIDTVAMDALKVKGYNPFTVTSYTIG